MDTKHKSVFETDFDMQDYLEKQVYALSDEGERVAAKEVLLDIFTELYQYSQKQYQKLDDKWQREREMEQQDFSILMGMEERKSYDRTNTSLFPILQEDLEEPKTDHAAGGFLYSVYVKADEGVCRRMEEEIRLFKATLHTTEGRFVGSVSVRRTERYDETLKELYHCFLDNGVTWNTINTTYLHKLFDVFLNPLALPQDAVLERVTVDFEEYEKYLHYDYIPLWNVQKIKVSPDMRPVPCLDRVHYEHHINRNRQRKDSQYLVAQKNMHITDIQRGSELVITCLEPACSKWELCEIRQIGSPESSPFCREPLLRNSRRSRTQKLLRTKADMERFLLSLGYEEYVTLTEITLADEASELEASYEMDAFIEDEFKKSEKRDRLVFSFQEKKKGDIFNLDRISYLVSAIQRELVEYKCVGILV